MNAKKLAAVIGGVAAMLAVIIFGVISLMGSAGTADTASANTPASGGTTASAFAQPTLPSSATSATAAPKSSTTPTPTPSATVSPDGAVPVVAPTLTPLQFTDMGYSPAMEANLTPEEVQARTTIYRVLPVLLNAASHKYASPAGARDELLSQNLITSGMASTGYFPQEFSNFQLAINKAQYTVQTTGMQCFMRGQSAQTALQLGHVTCYYTRHYLDAQGSAVGAVRYQSEVGGAGAIDPEQQQRSIFYMKKDGGVWKVDFVQIQAH